MNILQGGQGCQSLWHVAVELGQALLLVVLIFTRLHCNRNRKIDPFSWPWHSLYTRFRRPTEKSRFQLHPQLNKALGIIGLLSTPGHTQAIQPKVFVQGGQSYFRGL